MTTEKNLQPPAGGSSLNEGAKVDAERLAQEEAEPDKGNEQEQGSETEENVQLTPEQRRNAFAKAMQQYPEEFEEAMQHAARMAVQSIRENPQLNELGKVLAEAYGIDMSDMDGLIDAVKNGRVKNDEYYETLAAQRGISVKTRGRWTAWRASCSAPMLKSSRPNSCGWPRSTSSVQRQCVPGGKRKRQS